MVVIFFAAACEMGVEQERTGSPSTWTVHAPHRPAPQPNFVPVNSNVSRRTQSRGVSGATSTLRELPLTCRVIDAMFEEPWRYGQTSYSTGAEKGNGEAAGAVMSSFPELSSSSG